MEALLKQVIEKDFKPSNFTVYSIIEDDGFVAELEGMFDKKFAIDDFEYVVLDLSTKEKNGILYRMHFMMDRIADLKQLIEKEIQDNPLKPKSRVYVNKEKCYIFVIKLKEFDLKERIDKMKIGDEDNSSPITE
jgi:hypothetical protein